MVTPVQAHQRVSVGEHEGSAREVGSCGGACGAGVGWGMWGGGWLGHVELGLVEACGAGVDVDMWGLQVHLGAHGGEVDGAMWWLGGCVAEINISYITAV